MKDTTVWLRVHSVKDTSVPESSQWERYHSVAKVNHTVVHIPQCGSKCESRSGHSVLPQCETHSVHIVIHSDKLEHFFTLWYTLCPLCEPHCEPHCCSQCGHSLYHSVVYRVDTVATLNLYSQYEPVGMRYSSYYSLIINKIFTMYLSLRLQCIFSE